MIIEKEFMGFSWMITFLFIIKKKKKVESNSTSEKQKSFSTAYTKVIMNLNKKTLQLKCT